MEKSKCIIYLINKVAETKVTERPVYHNYPLMTFYEPSAFRELEHIARLSRHQAEEILKRRRERIMPVLKFFILKLSQNEGKKKADFTTLYPEIGVNERGEIEYMVAPNKSSSPFAHNVFQEYLLSKYIKTRDQKYLMRLMGVPVYKGRPTPVINWSWPKWKGKDITDLVAEDISWLFGPPKEERPSWEMGKPKKEKMPWEF